MNYRHAYHAGNFGDVLKHAVLCLCLEYLKQKDGAFFALDTHAGVGRYDLQSIEAQKTQEAVTGIAKLWSAQKPEAIVQILKPYVDAIKSLNNGNELKNYPGSPALIERLIRKQDRAMFYEAHPDDSAALRKLFHHNRKITIRAKNGWDSLKADLPPPERRGLVIIDPPYEQGDDFINLVAAAQEGMKRFATGTFILWYPVKGAEDAPRFIKKIGALHLPDALRIELHARAPNNAKRFDGSGMIVINPPWVLKDQLSVLLPFLSKLFETGKGSGFILENLQVS